MRVSRDLWVLVFLLALLAVGGYFIASPEAKEESKVSTSYNADPKGVKAFYTLLGERLGYSVDRLRRPYTRMPQKAAVLIVVQPLDQPPITPEERASLDAWVSGGGTVVFAADNLANVPPGFGSTRRLRKGYVYAFRSRAFITNKGMRDYTNALKILNIIRRHAGPRQLILFDEYHHSLGESRSGGLFGMMGRQVKIALVILAAAGLVLCHTRGRRFGAVRPLPPSETARPGFEFVESVAGLYRRAHASALAAEILCRSFRQQLASRLGLPADGSPDRMLRGLPSDTSDDTKAGVGRVLQLCEKLEAGQRMSEPELVNIAREIQQLERELGLAGFDA